jgi:hypothetical protein
MLLGHAVWSQTNEADKTIAGSVRNKIHKFTSIKRDTLNISTQAIADSLEKKLTDSVELITGGLDSLTHTKLASIDSLLNNNAGNVESKLDSLKGKTGAVAESGSDLLSMPQQQVDQRMDKISQTVNKPITDLNSKLNETASNLGEMANGELQMAQDKLDQVEQKVTSKAESLTEKVENLGGQQVPLPGVTQPEFSISEIPTDIPVADIPEVSIPNVDLPLGDGPSSNVSLPTTEIQKPSLVMPQTKAETGSLQIPNYEKEIVLPDANKELSGLDGSLAQVEQIETELKQVQEGNTEALEKRAEQQLAQLEPLKEVTSEINRVNAEQAKYAAMVQKYRDQKLLREEIQRKAQNVVNDRLNQHSQVFKDAQAQLARSKRKYEDVKSMSELPRQRTNPMKGKPFKQRFLPGATFQFYNNETVSTDISLHVGWRFSEKLTGYMAGVYRVGVSDSYEYIVKGLNVYGVRTYLDWEFKKGFYVHGELEALSAKGAAVPQGNGQGSLMLNDQLLSVCGGLGRSFNISRRIQGSLLALYRFELDGHIPEYSKFNVRIGFNYQLWRKKRSEGIKVSSLKHGMQ